MMGWLWTLARRLALAVLRTDAARLRRGLDLESVRGAVVTTAPLLDWAGGPPIEAHVGSASVRIAPTAGGGFVCWVQAGPFVDGEFPTVGHAMTAAMHGALDRAGCLVSLAAALSDNTPPAGWCAEHGAVGRYDGQGRCPHCGELCTGTGAELARSFFMDLRR